MHQQLEDYILTKKREFLLVTIVILRTTKLFAYIYIYIYPEYCKKGEKIEETTFANKYIFFNQTFIGMSFLKQKCTAQSYTGKERKAC